MDPATLSAAAVGLLGPYLRQLAEKTVDNLGDSLAGGVVQSMKRLYEGIKSRFSADPYASAQLTGAEERPDSARRQEALRGALEEVLAEDADFAALVERLVADVRAAGGTATSIVKDSGAVAGGDVTIRGHYAAGRDISIGKDGPPDRG